MSNETLEKAIAAGTTATATLQLNATASGAQEYTQLVKLATVVF
jgi:hypothetical protein